MHVNSIFFSREQEKLKPCIYKMFEIAFTISGVYNLTKNLLLLYVYK